mgnify:CR=1 FL=1
MTLVSTTTQEKVMWWQIPTYDKHLIHELGMMGSEFIHKPVEKILTTLTIRPNLLDEIKENQTKDEFICEEKRRIQEGQPSEFRIAEHGSLWYKTRLCVPNILDIKQIILKEAHNIPYTPYTQVAQKCTVISRVHFGGEI